jgi:flagellar hook-length control protein FliK
MPLVAAAADIAGLAAPAPTSEHKIMLRPVETAADPAPSAAASTAPLEQAAPVLMPAVAATVTSTTTTSQAHPATPAEQVAPALLTLAKTADGSQQMTVRLQPGDLGMVQVRIARAASGSTQIEITADNPSTLLALQRDQPQLHRTLDEAGIPAAGRSVSFHAAAAAQAEGSSSGSGSSAGYGNSQPGASGRSHAGTSDADGSAGGRGGYAAPERNLYSASRQTNKTSAATRTAIAPLAQSYRIGLDITA